MRPALGQLRSFSTLSQCFGQWAMGILLCSATSPSAVGSGAPCALLTASLPSGSRLGTLFVQSVTAFRQWAVELLLYTATATLPCGSGKSELLLYIATPPWGGRLAKLLLCIASLHGGSGHWNSPQYLIAYG